MSYGKISKLKILIWELIDKKGLLVKYCRKGGEENMRIHMLHEALTIGPYEFEVWVLSTVQIW